MKTIDEHEIPLILAGLHMLKDGILAGNLADEYREIATEKGASDLPTGDEIDALCERLSED